MTIFFLTKRKKPSLIYSFHQNGLPRFNISIVVYFELSKGKKYWLIDGLSFFNIIGNQQFKALTNTSKHLKFTVDFLRIEEKGFVFFFFTRFKQQNCVFFCNLQITCEKKKLAVTVYYIVKKLSFYCFDFANKIILKVKVLFSVSLVHYSHMENWKGYIWLMSFEVYFPFNSLFSVNSIGPILFIAGYQNINK